MGCHTWFYIPTEKEKPKVSFELIRTVDGKNYQEVARATNGQDTFHDCFRAGWNYHDVILKSLDETLEFLKKEDIETWKEGDDADYVPSGRENRIEKQQASEYRVREFFTKYPDGIIMFG